MLCELRKPALAAVVLLAAAAQQAKAQEQEGAGAEASAEAQAATSTAQVYTPADLARFAPRNALDMLNQVPGFAIRDGDGDQRGLGQADTNVLIDGQRVASKSDGVFAQLQRIGTTRVERIEIVDGGSLGIPGVTGQVANIITKPSAISGRFSYRAGFRSAYADPSFFGGEISLSGSGERFNWTVAYSHGTGRGGAGGGDAYITNPNGLITDDRDALIVFNGEFPRLSGNAKYTTAGGTIIEANASHSRNYSDFSNDELRRPTGLVQRFRDFDNRNRGWSYELGGNVDFAAGPGRLKVIGLERFNRFRVRQTSRTDFADTSPDVGNRFASTSDTGERVGRAEYSWPMLGGTWQWDAEAAFNRLDRTAALFDLSTNGNFVEVPFPDSSGGVREDRYETILTHNRTLAPRLTLQIGAGGEYSQLSQSGPGGLVREFWRPKGSLNLAFAVRDGFDISLGLEREVGQLSFGDFLSSVALAQGNQNAGNVLLVPYQEWEVELEVNKRLGAWGSTTLRLFAEWYDDFLDIVPAPGGAEATGNISGARNMGARWNSTFNLDLIGFRGAKIDSTFEAQRSRQPDALTGEIRQHSGHVDRSADVQLRHDVPGSDWAWGLGVEYNHTLPYYRLSEVGREFEGPAYTYAFIEHKDVFGMTAHLSAFNLTDGRGRYERTVYDGYRDRSPVLFNEYRSLKVAYIFNFNLSGSF